MFTDSDIGFGEGSLIFIKGMQSARILQLPLATDAYLRHTMELSLQYYKAVMAK